MMILEEMEGQGKISWKKEGVKDAFFVNKFSCYEIADAIYNWVSAKYDKKNSDFCCRRREKGKLVRLKP